MTTKELQRTQYTGAFDTKGHEIAKQLAMLTKANQELPQGVFTAVTVPRDFTDIKKGYSCNIYHNFIDRRLPPDMQPEEALKKIAASCVYEAASAADKEVEVIGEEVTTIAAQNGAFLSSFEEGWNVPEIVSESDTE